MATTQEHKDMQLSDIQRVNELQHELEEIALKTKTLSLDKIMELQQQRTQLEIKLFTLKTRFKTRKHIATNSTYHILK